MFYGVSAQGAVPGTILDRAVGTPKVAISGEGVPDVIDDVVTASEVSDGGGNSFGSDVIRGIIGGY